MIKMQFKEKLLLVIDGLDEIIADRILETGHTIFDYIPAPQQLAENVYILLTCRTGEEEPLSQFVSQRIEHLSLTESYTVDRKSTEHEENLQRYLKKYCLPQRMIRQRRLSTGQAEIMSA